MRTIEEVTGDKLRGGFYSPEPLVDLCLQRIAILTRGQSAIRFLEPSSGDGAFVRGLARNESLKRRTAHFEAIELLPAEAAKCSAELEAQGISGSVKVSSAIAWAASTDDHFQAAVGNPPFVRFQFVPESEGEAIGQLERRLGVSFAGVSNLWLPVLLGSLNRVALGGAFAFIVPAECFTGISAGHFRQWLIQNTAALRFDLFPPGSFPSVLQEVVIVSGQRNRETLGSAGLCEICEHSTNYSAATSTHSIPPTRQPWTRYLLAKQEIEAFEEASHLANIWPLGQVAKFEVAAVTGANDFFSVDLATLSAFDLNAWSTPLLPRIRHAAGLRYTSDDHVLTTQAGAKTHLLDFSSERADPSKNPRVVKYIDLGVREGLPHRYKCRIRSPWYRVPFIRSGRLMMSKRSHFHPRVVLNEADVVTTDTIYRGNMIGAFAGREVDLTTTFHNSLTLLAAEIEGRSFGGGVLELVPSEVARLLVPMVDGFGAEIDRLDAIARSSGAGLENALIEETDLLLMKADIGLTSDLIERLDRGRRSLLRRRLDRNTAT